MFVKYVREDLREINPMKNKGKKRVDVLSSIIGRYKSEARWEKAIQHLRDDGKITGELKDIGEIIKEIHRDTFKECDKDIKEILFDYFKGEISRGIVKGLPEFYKKNYYEKSIR